MPFIKRINYLKGFTSLFLLAGISLSFLILIVLYSEFMKFQDMLNKEKAEHEILLKKEKVFEHYKYFENFLLTVENNRFLKNFIEDNSKDKKNNLITLFKTLAMNEKYITQLRYIDENGQEVIRVDRNKITEKIKLVPKNKLQNKKNRDYFINTMRLNKGEIYVSKLDLNIENGEIEVPYKPVWRFAMKVFLNNQEKGIVIVNIFAQYMLEDILQSSSFYIDIFDENEQILVSSFKEKKQWTKYLKTKSDLKKDDFVKSDILIQDINHEKLYIALTSKNWINDFLKLLNLNIILLIIFVFIASYIIAYFLAKIPKKLFDELELQQNMLIQQSKLAAMGEMTSMIAHQWRQPLNGISVLLQEIEIKKEMEVLSDDEFNSISKNIKMTLNHMSKTIDSFRDFFKPSKKKNFFDIKDAIKNVQDILKIRIQKLDLKFDVKVASNLDKNCFLINSYESEFKQVIINIINNSIDALESFINEDRYIKIDLECNKEKIVIKILDNAGGIKNSILSSIFEPYSTTKEEQNGTGLGLYMSKMIIEKNMGGNIKAYNKDDGACFEISLPK